MKIENLQEIWYCSHCGHEVKESDEFCVACESLFTGTTLAASSRFRELWETDSSDMINAAQPAEIKLAF
ncbi:MAG: zinc ribbon domain-containing protein [bacterium]